MIAILHDGAKMKLFVGGATMGLAIEKLELDAWDMRQLDFTDPKILDWWQCCIQTKFCHIDKEGETLISK